MVHRYRLLALDVDGTLVEGEHGTPSPRLKAAIAAILDSTHVVLCTGRDEEEAERIVEALTLQDQWQILGGGSLILSPSGEREIGNHIESDLAGQLVAQVGRDAVRTYALSPQGWEVYVPGTRSYMLSFHSRSGTHADEMVRALAPWADKVFITKVSDTEQPQQVNVHCCPRGVDKGTALKRVAARLEITRDEIISIGDMPIDLPMFEQSGLAVAMGNAPEEVKARAHIVAPSLIEDGVAHIIERYLLR